MINARDEIVQDNNDVKSFSSIFRIASYLRREDRPFRGERVSSASSGILLPVQLTVQQDRMNHCQSRLLSLRYRPLLFLDFASLAFTVCLSA